MALSPRTTEIIEAIFPSRAFEITPSDSADNIYDWIYVGGTGDLTVETAGGDEVTYLSVAVGPLYVRTAKILATGTDATNLIGHRGK